MWKSSIVVDKTIQYDAESSTGLFDYDEWGKHSQIPLLPQTPRVDVIVQQAGSQNVVWLVEVKDYRILTQRPKRKNLEDLDQTLAKKLAATLAVLKTTAEVPQELAGAVSYADHLYYVVHIERPQNPPAYFPSGFPVTQFQLFQSSPERRLVHASLLRDAESINRDPSLPWQATLL